MFRHPRLVLALALLVASAGAAAQQSIDKVNGSITAESGQVYGSLETVNGSIRLEDRSKARNVETVNGSIRGGDEIETGTLETVNGAIRVGRGARIDGNAETVNGSIFVDREGRVDGSVVTVNGGIGLVRTEVTGGIETVNGDVTVGIGSHVRGGLKVSKPSSNWLPISFNKRKPRIVIGPDAVVEGDLVFEREVTLYVHDSARIGNVSGATAVRYSGDVAPKD